MKLPREILDAAQDEASKQGVTLTFEDGRTHPKMIMQKGTRTKRVPISMSPRTLSNQKNWVRQDIRRFANGVR